MVAEKPESPPPEAESESSARGTVWNVVNQLDAVLLASICTAHVLLIPYTKVEESFNLQAVYDLLYRDWKFPSTFDHATFPGVVPRTFLGPLALCGLLRPITRFTSLSPHATLLATRLVLAGLNVGSLLSIRAALHKRNERLVGTLFTLLTAVQFHIPYYAGRTLPNVFALILTNIALAARVSATGPRTALVAHAALALGVAVFRSELCILLFFTIVHDAYAQHSNFFVSAVTALLCAFAGAVVSVIVDTHFWGDVPHNPFPDVFERTKLRYPELEVFYFNAILGKSSAWGTSPWHWYFTSALPRTLMGSVPLMLIALVATRGAARRVCARVAFPAIVFVAVYSCLPHKELRFIFYAIPALTICAAYGGAALLSASSTTRTDRFAAALAITVCIGLSAVVTTVSTTASYHNYPGATALHALARSGACENTKVHIDAHAASNGISQFVQATASGDCDWDISRAEELDEHEYSEFTHLVSRNKTVPGFRLLHEAHTFTGLDIKAVKVHTAPDVYVHERIKDEL